MAGAKEQRQDKKSARKAARERVHGGGDGKSTEEKGKTVGRPRTTVDDLPEGWQQIMLDEGQSGMGATGIMVKLGLSPRVLETLLQDSEEFRNNYEAALLLCRYWWEMAGRNMAQGAPGNAAVWAMNMYNRFGWRSPNNTNNAPAALEHTVETQEQIQQLTQDELVAELRARGLPTSLLTFKD